MRELKAPSEPLAWGLRVTAEQWTLLLAAAGKVQKQIHL